MSTLTEREKEVVRLVAQGLTNKSIASVMGISVHTVKHHLVNVGQKLGIHSKTEIAVLAVREGLV